MPSLLIPSFLFHTICSTYFVPHSLPYAVFSIPSPDHKTPSGKMLFQAQHLPQILLSDVVSVCSSLHLQVSSEAHTSHESIAALHTVVPVSVSILRMLPSEIDKSELMSHLSFFSNALFRLAAEAKSLNEKVLLFSRSALGYSVFPLCHPDSYHILEAFLQASAYVAFWFERASAADSEELAAAISDVFREIVAIRSELRSAIYLLDDHRLSNLLNGITQILGLKLQGEWVSLTGAKLCFCSGEIYVNLQTLQISCPIELVPSSISNSPIVNQAISEKMNFDCVVDHFKCLNVYSVKDNSLRAYSIQTSSLMKDDEFMRAQLSNFVKVKPGKEHLFDCISNQILLHFWSFMYPYVDSDNVFVQNRDDVNVIYMAKHTSGCWLEITLLCRDFIPPLLQVYQITGVNSASSIGRVLIFSSDRRFSYSKKPLEYPRGVSGLPRVNKNMLHSDLLLSELYMQPPSAPEAVSVLRDGAEGREVFVPQEMLEGLVPLCLLRNKKIKFWLQLDSQIVQSESETEAVGIKIKRDQSSGIVSLHSVDNFTQESFILMNTASAYLSAKTCNLLRTFACIESMNYVCFWAKSFDDTCPQRVHLPRLGITFNLCSKNQQFETLVEGKHLFLVEYAEALHVFDDLPVHFHAFLQCSLVLRNEVQDVFLLTSCAALNCVRRDENGHLFSSHVDQDDDADTIRYIVYPLHRFGLGLTNLAPCSWKARFAIFANCIFKNYDEAIRMAMYEYSANIVHDDNIVFQSILKLGEGKTWKESDPRFRVLLDLMVPSSSPCCRVFNALRQRGFQHPPSCFSPPEVGVKTPATPPLKAIESILGLKEGRILQLQQSALLDQTVRLQDRFFIELLQMSPPTTSTFFQMVSESFLSFGGSREDRLFEALHERFFEAVTISCHVRDFSVMHLASDLFVAFCGNVHAEPSLHLSVIAAFLYETKTDLGLFDATNKHWQVLIRLSAVYYLFHLSPRHHAAKYEGADMIIRHFSDFCYGLGTAHHTELDNADSFIQMSATADAAPFDLYEEPFNIFGELNPEPTATDSHQSGGSSGRSEVAGQTCAAHLSPEDCHTVCEWIHALADPNPNIFGTCVLQWWNETLKEDDAQMQQSAQCLARISMWLLRCQRHELIDIHECERLKTDLVWFKLREESRLRELLRRFLDSVNQFPQLDGNGICGNIDMSCGNRMLFSFQELVSLWVYHPSCRLHHNGIADISTTILSLLCAMGRTEYFSVTLGSALSAASREREAVESMLNLGQCLHNYRNITDRRDVKQLLAFEFANGITIRPDQLKMVDSMMLQQGSGQRVVIHQAIMGCGKTAVICPYLALKLADQPVHDDDRRLVMVICPPSLLLQTSQQLQSKLSTVFCKQIHVAAFDRYVTLCVNSLVFICLSYPS